MRVSPGVRVLAGWFLGLFVLPALADGQVIDKVYLPYVQPLEREVELRLSSSNDAAAKAETWRLGYGQAVGQHLFVEAYLVGQRDQHAGGMALEGQELEARWQLTEAGEYAADWGLMAELEHENDAHAWEFSTTLIGSRSWGRWTGTANLALAYESGRDIDREFDTGASLQWKYRHAEALEPGLEVYLGENTRGIGPVLMGTTRVSQRRKLHWELGLIFAADERTPDRTLRGLLEFEF